MQVLQCNLWGHIPEEMESDNLVEFTRDLVARRVKFTLKTVPENTDPARVTDILIGYNPGYDRMYISNIDRESGLVWVQFDVKKLLYDAQAPHIIDHRDSVAYIGAPTRYIRGGYDEVIEEFQGAGFSLFDFKAEFPGDSLLK